LRLELHLAGGSFLFGFATDKRVVQLGQRVEVGRLEVIFLRLGLIPLGLASLTKAVQVAGIQQVGLLKFSNRGVVLLAGQGQATNQLVELAVLAGVLGGLAKFLGMGLGRSKVFFSESDVRQVEMVLQPGVVLDLL